MHELEVLLNRLKMEHLSYHVESLLELKWSTKTGHRVRVFPVSIFRFVWG